MLGVEDVQGRSQGLQALAAPSLLFPGDPRLQGHAGVGDDVPQVVPGLQPPGPGRARQATDLLAQEPGHARRLDAHQHGAAVEEDLVEAADQDQGPASRIEPGQDPAGRHAGGPVPPPDRGPRGGPPRPQDQDQQDADLGRAQAHRRGRRGEPLLLPRGELDGRVDPPPEPVILVAEGPVLADQLLAGRAVGILGRDGGVDLAGLIVDGLTTAAGLTCLGGDGATGVAEAGGRIGDPTHKGYGAHRGVASVGVGLSLFPLCRTAPPPDQEELGHPRPTVKLRSPESVRFGTMPFGQ